MEVRRAQPWSFCGEELVSFGRINVLVITQACEDGHEPARAEEAGQIYVNKSF